MYKTICADYLCTTLFFFSYFFGIGIITYIHNTTFTTMSINPTNCMSCESLLEISFPCNEHAEMVKSCLEVDEELQPNKLIKEFLVENNILKV